MNISQKATRVTKTQRRLVAVRYALIFGVLTTFQNASAAVIWYTSHSAWLAAIGAPTTTFSFTGANIPLADETNSIPSPNTNLGINKLTFGSGNTGLPVDFSFEKYGNANTIEYTTNALGVGPSTDHDWRVNFGSSSTVTRFGIYYNSANTLTNDVRVYDPTGNQLGSWLGACCTTLPTGTFFLGVISTQAVGRLDWLDNTNLGGTTLAAIEAPVPVPAAAWLLGSALAGLGAVRRRQATT